MASADHLDGRRNAANPGDRLRGGPHALVDQDDIRLKGRKIS
jgi:hypothetical protein